jgi:hypothetical protein
VAEAVEAAQTTDETEFAPRTRAVPAGCGQRRYRGAPEEQDLRPVRA